MRVKISSYLADDRLEKKEEKEIISRRVFLTAKRSVPSPGTYEYEIGSRTDAASRYAAQRRAAISIPCRSLERIKVLGVQAATDSYIYTFRGFSISRFVECTRRCRGLTPRGTARRSTANNVGRICICQKLRRRLVRAMAPVAAMPSFENRRLRDASRVREFRGF